MSQLLVVLVTITLSLGLYRAATQVFDIPFINHPLCHQGYCGEMSYDDLLSLYPGLFTSKMEFAAKVEQQAASRMSSLQREGVVPPDNDVVPGDGDACCATEKENTINYTMTNIAGELKSIVHMPDHSPPRYQIIPHNKCVPNYGYCIGKCVIEPIYITLLVSDLDGGSMPHLTFDTFEVPGYCSCKNVDSRTVV